MAASALCCRACSRRTHLGLAREEGRHHHRVDVREEDGRDHPREDRVAPRVAALGMLLVRRDLRLAADAVDVRE